MVIKAYKFKNKDKKTRVAIIIPDKIDFKTKSVNRDKERYFIIIAQLIRKK